MIKISSPTRVDLAGGTLDCWPLFLFVENCQTVNLAIDINTGVELEPTSNQKIFINVADYNYEQKFSSLAELLNSNDRELTLLKPHIDYWQPTSGFNLKTFSESPVGGGLGGSSSLCISLLKAFSQWLNRPIDMNEMVTVAHNLEAKVLKTPTGTQDYFPPICGGLNIIHYGLEGPRLEALPESFETISQNIMVVYTGKTHHSGINNWQVIKSAVDGDKSTLLGLNKIAEISQDMAEVCRNMQWEKIPDLFHAEFEARVKLSPAFTSPEIERLQKLVLQSGGQAVKICGAGGGGCVVVWAPADKHEGIKSQCLKNGFQPLDAKPVGTIIKAD